MLVLMDSFVNRIKFFFRNSQSFFLDPSVPMNVRHQPFELVSNPLRFDWDVPFRKLKGGARLDYHGGQI